MSKPTLTLLQGGLNSEFIPAEDNFISAYITDTRLMGVLVLGMFFGQEADPVKKIYKAEDYGKDSEMQYHMFFYFDIEEYGLETFKGIPGFDTDNVFNAENSMIGGLGANKIPVSLNEAKYILQYYANYNRLHNLPLPEGLEKYDFLLRNRVALSEPDQYILMKKQCVKLINDYEVINYFLMRITGKDFIAAEFLTNGDVKLNLFPEYKAGTFCKNTITAIDRDKGLYRCESLIEWGNEYYITVTCVTVQFQHVVDFERISGFPITTSEAAMLLSQSEYINVYEFNGDIEDKASLIAGLLSHSTVKRYESGTLFMLFHTDNRHVAKPDYRLSEDMIGNIYLVDTSQIILAAYTEEDALRTEKILLNTAAGANITSISRLEFTDPVLYDFIQSGIDDFDKFLDIITFFDE